MLRLEKTQDRDLLHLEPVHEKHVPQMKGLWNTQYAKMVDKHHFLSRKWLSDPAPFARFIEQHIDSRCSMVVTLGEEVIGFMMWDMFDFHGENTAFFPIMAHAAAESYRLATYNMLYTHIAQRLVEAGCINHLLTFFAGDHTLQEYLFELGFGLYVVDAYRDVTSLSIKKLPDITVRLAQSDDVDELSLLMSESTVYYAASPLFLKVEVREIGETKELLASPDYAVFLAEKNSRAIGWLGIRRCHDDDVITLCDPATASLDPVGAYIQKEYRGLGIGEQLLHAAITWGRQQAVRAIHVDFESANTYARQFWPKHFAPILYSVKRHLNADAG